MMARVKKKTGRKSGRAKASRERRVVPTLQQLIENLQELNRWQSHLLKEAAQRIDKLATAQENDKGN